MWNECFRNKSEKTFQIKVFPKILLVVRCGNTCIRSVYLRNKNQTVQSNESGGCCPANTQSVQPEEKKCCGTQPQPEQEESCCDTTFN